MFFIEFSFVPECVAKVTRGLIKNNIWAKAQSSEKIFYWVCLVLVFVSNFACVRNIISLTQACVRGRIEGEKYDRGGRKVFFPFKIFSILKNGDNIMRYVFVYIESVHASNFKSQIYQKFLLIATPKKDDFYIHISFRKN